MVGIIGMAMLVIAAIIVASIAMAIVPSIIMPAIRITIIPSMIVAAGPKAEIDRGRSYSAWRLSVNHRRWRLTNRRRNEDGCRPAESDPRQRKRRQRQPEIQAHAGL